MELYRGIIAGIGYSIILCTLVYLVRDSIKMYIQKRVYDEMRDHERFYHE